MDATILHSASASSDPAAPTRAAAHPPGVLTRWLHHRRSERRRIDHAVWDLHERYGEAACGIAQVSSRQPIGSAEKRFWRRVALRLRRMS